MAVYRIRSPLTGWNEFDAETDIDAYGKFCDKVGYTVFDACTIETVHFEPCRGDSIPRDYVKAASKLRNKVYMARARKPDYDGRK